MDINELSQNNVIGDVAQDGYTHNSETNTLQIIQNLKNRKDIKNKNVFIPTLENIEARFSKKHNCDTLLEPMPPTPPVEVVDTPSLKKEGTVLEISGSNHLNELTYISKIDTNHSSKKHITNMIMKVLKNYKVKNINIVNDVNSFINKRVKKIYVINLLEDVYKRNYIITIMKKLGINFNLIIVERVSADLCKQLCKNSLSKGELGCTLSHLWCLLNSINNNDENMIIFEDDIIMHKDFTNYFSYIYDNNPKLDFLLLGAHDLNFSRNNYKQVKNNLYVPVPTTTNIYGAHSNYYSLTGARRMFYLRITNLSFFDKEYMLLFNKFPNSYVVYPNMVVTNVSESTLNHTRELFSKNEQDYYNRCFINFNFTDYNFLYVNLLKNLNYIDVGKDDYEKVTERYLYNTFHDFVKIEDIKKRIVDDFFTVEDITNIISIH
jgi:GR25 family glycosyltransferase involved in LPS biosynthesis